MQARIPFKGVCERFYLTYEFKGAQKAVKCLTRYRVRGMRITVDDRITRTRKRALACYQENTAHFTRKGLNKCGVLHESYYRFATVFFQPFLVSQERARKLVMYLR